MINNTVKFSTENPIRIDVTGCKYPDLLHDILRDSFGFPNYYGKNWDAFWDYISEMFFVNDNRVIQLTGFYSLPEELREYCNPMLEIFQDIHTEHPGVTFQILS